jgi:hypothetical protein
MALKNYHYSHIKFMSGMIKKANSPLSHKRKIFEVVTFRAINRKSDN